MARIIVRLLALPVALAIGACTGPSEVREGEWYSNWDLDGGCRSTLPGPERRDASGAPSDFCKSVAPGRWVWVVYGAPWCSASRNQAARMREFEGRAGSALVLHSVLTSGPEPLSIARLDDARAWSGMTGLPTARVSFDPLESDPRTVPMHLVVGPDGRTWFRWIGPLDTATMLARLQAFESGGEGSRARPMEDG